MRDSRTLIVVGMGPGSMDQLTLEADEVLRNTDIAFARTLVHPSISALKDRYPHLELRSFDPLYETSDTFEDVYGRIVAELLQHAMDGSAVYLVPGSPTVGERTVELLRPLCEAEGVSLRIVHGVSFLEPVLSSVSEFETTWLTIVDATEIDLLASETALGEIAGHSGTPPARTPVPTAPLLISQVYSAETASSVKLWLSRSWPEDHQVVVIRAAGTAEESRDTTAIRLLHELTYDHLTAVFVPAIDPLEDVRTFAGLLNVTRRLRAPGGCAWDREQTHDSLKPHLIDETYEVVEALDEQDYDKLTEELGDLLFQVTIHSQVAAEHDEFDIYDVVAGISSKLISRHPHVFGDLRLETSAAVLERWETMKQVEKPERPSVLSSIPIAMPALPYSYAIQRRAAGQGFEWPDIHALLTKLDEEIGEFREAVAESEPRSRVLEELGDIFFALVSVGRMLKLDPEEALRRANRKFVRRFQFVESQVKASDRRLKELSAQQLDDLWSEAKLAD